MQKIGIGIIGVGDAGEKIHLKNYLTNPLCEIKGIADYDKNKLLAISKHYGITNCYEDYHNLLKRPDVEAVSIATPPHTHAEISIDAMRLGKHVLCEKPMCMTVKEANKMIKTEKKTNTKLMIGFSYRFLEPYRYIKTTMDSKKLGKLFLIRDIAYIGSPKNKSRSSWLFNLSHTPGVAFSETGSHLIDRVCWYFGKEIKEILATSLSYKNTPQLDHTTIATLKFADNKIGEIIVSYNITIPKTVKSGLYFTEVCSERGTIFLDLEKFYNKSQCITAYYPDRKIKLSIPINNCFKEEIGSFLKCIIKDIKPPITSMDGKQNLEILLATYESIKTKRVVRI